YIQQQELRRQLHQIWNDQQRHIQQQLQKQIELQETQTGKSFSVTKICTYGSGGWKTGADVSCVIYDLSGGGYMTGVLQWSAWCMV
ncbi:hypothetical protein QQ73_09615, partial [Candidatus Endoriftia persephone str. Guaymas]|nr:hypothetical protein [Candidatus Endoriftia persephone str. Guaymas]